MRISIAFLAFVLALAALALNLFPRTTAVPFSQQESAYARVIRTDVLRCGYTLFPPFASVDPNSGKLGGIDPPYVEALAKNLGLSVTWQEVQSGQDVEALRNHKVDAVCAGEGPFIATASAFIHYTEPAYYVPLYPYVRADDLRFDADITKANDADVTVVFMDGDLTQEFAERLFPIAKKHQLPGSAEYSQLYMDIATGKADFTIDDTLTAGAFMKSNPGKLRRVPLGHPVAIIPDQIAVLYGEEALVAMLNQGISNLRLRGIEDEILGTYEKSYPGAFYRAARSYAMP
jgi:ABC-type amino acid transport substrate-binding protein